MPAPGEPGLGIVLNEAVVESHPYTSGGRLHLEMCQTPLDSNNRKIITELD
jgi:galactonate dehydratase